MSHEIKIDGAGQAYFTARGEPGWHRLGTVFPFDEHVTLVEAGERTGMNFHTEMHPVLVQIGDKLIPMADHMAICRPPLGLETDWVPMEVVGKNYQQVANDNLFETFNELSEVFPVETIGLLGDGERIFVSLDAGMVDVRGDVVHQYLTIYDEKSGRSATKVILTPVRVVCANTMRWGLAEATLTLNVAHVKGNLGRLEKIAEIALDLQHRLDMSKQLFGHMAVTPFGLAEFKAAVLQIYPPPPPPEDLKVIDVSAEFSRLAQSQEQHRNLALGLFEKFNDEQPDLAYTQWSAWQSVIELEDWKKGRGNGQFVSALFGQRADTKMDAFRAITNLR